MGRWRSSDVWRFTARGCSARPRRMTVVLEISGLGKTYKSGHNALSDVDLSINKGEIFALLGPNGAGKTTMISIRSEEHTSELQSLMRISYAVFCLKTKTKKTGNIKT